MIDLSLYLVTDRSLSRGRSNIEVVKSAVAGGVSCVQLREKTCSTREFLDEALMLKKLLQPLGIPLFINDRLDIALAAEADGVHLGQQDMPMLQARNLAGNALIIGISAESVQDALRAEEEGADYIGVSPVFSTMTKTDTAAPLGLVGVQAIRAAVSIPIVGIGGISAANAASVVSAGADGVAVVSAIVSADSPEEAARDIRRALSPAGQTNSTTGVK